MQQLLGPQVGPQPLVYRLIYLQTKPILKNKFVKIVLKFQQKVLRIVGTYVLKLKMQQLLGPQVGPQPLVYRLIYLQTKPILKNKFVKIVLKFQQKVLRIVGTYVLKLKMQQLLGPQVGPQPLVYRLIYLQTKPILKNKFVKIPRIFYIEIDIK